MKIISWNCCLPPWSLSRNIRLPKLVTFLAEHEADVICLQEVFFKRDGLFLAKYFSGLGLIYSNHFKNLLILSRFPLNYATGDVYSQQGRLLSWSFLDVIYGKAFQIVVLKNSDEPLKIINTHLLSAKGANGKIYQSVRNEQIKQVTSSSIPSETTFLCGDLNFEPGSECYLKAIDWGYIDVFAEDLSATFGNKRIDYILCKNVEIKDFSAKVIKTTLSDHSALSLVLK